MKRENMLSHGIALDLALELTKKAQQHFDYDRYFRFSDKRLDVAINILPQKYEFAYGRTSDTDLKVERQIFKSNAKFGILYPTNNKLKELNAFDNYVKLIGRDFDKQLDSIFPYI